MSIPIFYAWQLDRDKKVCRYLIKKAAEQAVKKLRADADIKSAPPLDLDEATKGVTGHPHIAATIRKKISKCGVFLADLTHVAEYATADGRKKRAQNGNVLIELGMAIKAKGFGRLILVMNDAFGPPEDLPFDLKSHTFPITYTLADMSDPAMVNAARDGLAKSIGDKLKPMLIAINEEAAAKLKADDEAATKVSVSCQMALAMIPGRGPTKFLSITAVNTGIRPVTINQAAIILSDGRMGVPAMNKHLGPWKLPMKLAESDKVDVLAEVESFYNEMVSARKAGKPITLARAIVTDTTGRTYSSSPLDSFSEEDLKPV